MPKIRELLRLKYDAGLSHEKIARALQMSKGAVSKYVSLASAHQLSWPLAPELDDQALEARLLSQGGAPARYREPDFGTIHQQLKHKGVTRQLLWSEYVAEQPENALGYTQFCTRYRIWRQQQRRSLRQGHRAGEKLFIDYAGQTVEVVERTTGQSRSAQIFVAVLGASNYTFAEASWSQDLAQWVGSHTRAFSFFGGVPELLVPDNLRSGVSDACRYEPKINATYAELARHYGTAVLPARPYKPKDKSKAEVGVQIVERWILARLRHQTFFSLAQLNTAIRELLDELNERPFQRLPGSRRSAFEQLDQPMLRPLPNSPYVFARWQRARVGVDCHIHLSGHYYSVPQRLVGKHVDVRVSETTIEVLFASQRVASHPRQHAYGYSTIDEHLPERHRQHRQWTPARFLDWAATIGKQTRAVVAHLLHERPHPEQGYRSCLGLRRLAKLYGHNRLEAACLRASHLGAPSYRSINNILKRRLDEQPLPPNLTSDNRDNADHDASETAALHNNLRGPDYYH